MIDFPRTQQEAAPASWGAQIQEPHDDPRDAFFELLGRKAIGLPGECSGALRRHFNRLLRKAVYVRDNYFCVYCGKDMLSDVDSLLRLTKDHVKPKSRGGPNNVRNTVCCCQTCNKLKADTPCDNVHEGRGIVTELRRERAQILSELRKIYR